VYGQPFTLPEVRVFLSATPGVRFLDEDDAPTNVLAFASIQRAAQLFPDRFEQPARRSFRICPLPTAAAVEHWGPPHRSPESEELRGLARESRRDLEAEGYSLPEWMKRGAQ